MGYAGWVENVVDSSRFDRIDPNRFPCCRFVMPEVDLRDVTPCESSRDVTCESSRIVKCFRRIDSVWVYWTWGSLSAIARKDAICNLQISDDPVYTLGVGSHFTYNIELSCKKNSVLEQIRFPTGNSKCLVPKRPIYIR